MPDQKQPEQRSSTRPADTPDKAGPQPTGNESFPPKPTATNEADNPPVAAGAAPGAAPDGGAGQDWNRVLEESLANMQSVAAEYYEKLGQTAEQLTEQARQVYASSQTYVRSHPSSTLLGAFGLGVLLGLLSDRD